MEIGTVVMVFFDGNIILSEKVNLANLFQDYADYRTFGLFFHCFILVIITVHLQFVPIFCISSQIFHCFHEIFMVTI